MPEGNPLVAAPKSSTTGYTGVSIAESAVGLAHGIKSGDWVEVGLSAVGGPLDVLAMVIDPLGTLGSYGVNSLIEHVRPLKGTLDWFAGHSAVIPSFSRTLGNVAKAVAGVAKD